MRCLFAPIFQCTCNFVAYLYYTTFLAFFQIFPCLLRKFILYRKYIIFYFSTLFELHIRKKQVTQMGATCFFFTYKLRHWHLRMSRLPVSYWLDSIPQDSWFWKSSESAGSSIESSPKIPSSPISSINSLAIFLPPICCRLNY